MPILYSEGGVKNVIRTSRRAKHLLKEGIYIIGFSFPVIPVEQARIRIQISAAHSHD